MRHRLSTHQGTNPSARLARVALGLLAAALALLALAPLAAADFQTRPQITSFGPLGTGACADDAFATGSGDLDAAAGTGDYVVLATGSGDLTEGSTTVANVVTDTGAFAVGESISTTNGIPAGTTIAAVGPGTLTLSNPATGTATRNLRSLSKTIENVVTDTGTFAVGMEISAIRVPAGTTITAVGPDDLTLSDAPTNTTPIRNLVAGFPEISVTPTCGSLEVGQTIEGAGIADGTTIAALGPGTVTLSDHPIAPGTGVELAAFFAFEDASAIAFDQANQRLYVLDAGDPATIYAFDASTPGTYTPLDAGNGHPNFPLTGIADAAGSSDIAVDNSGLGSNGRLYYVGCTLFSATSGNCNEYKLFAFDSDGAEIDAGNGHPNFPRVVESGPTASIGGTTVDAGANVWVGKPRTSQTRIDRYDSDGAPLTPVGTPQLSPRDVDLDSGDNLYFIDGGVRRYSATSGYAPAAGTIVGGAQKVTVDRSEDDLYAVRTNNFDFFTYVFDASVSQLYAFGGNGGGDDIAIDEFGDTAFLSAGIAAGASEVRAFGPPQTFPDPVATAQAATLVTQTTARLNGLVDDNGPVANQWRFEVSSDDGATWAVTGGDFSTLANLVGPSHTTPGGQSGFPVSVSVGGLDAGTTYRVRLVVRNNPATPAIPSGELTFTTDPIDPAIVTPAAPANVTTTTADLSATIDDNGPLPTNWQLQISPDGVAWTTAESGTTAGGASDTVVAGTAVGLNPSTSYQYRVLTDKGPGSVAESTPGPGFTTDVAPPTISAVGAYAIQDTSARLVAAVNPNALSSAYQFHYGTSPGSLDTPVPASPASLGAGSDPVAVSQELTGLEPDTDYYFQLTATNAEGPASSPLQSFHTRLLPLPNPDGRAYEQVSPVDKSFGVVGVQIRPSVVVAAWDGDAAAFQSSTPFGGAQVTTTKAIHLSRRGSGGWQTRWPNSSFCRVDRTAPSPLLTNVTALLSPDLDRGAVGQPESASCQIPPLDPAAPLPQRNLYLADYTTDSNGYQLLAPVASAASSPDVNTQSGAFVGAADDYSRVVFTSTGKQTFDVPVGNFDKLFLWDNGTLSLISRSVVGAPLTSSSSVPVDALNGVSADGSHVFFQNPTSGAGEELYLRVAGVTRWVSEQECSPACPDDTAADVFEWATPGGEKAFFLSSAKHTNEDTSTTGSDLYRYTDSANPSVDQNLALISKDSETDDGDSADVLGMLGTSDDGDTVYFAANGQLVDGEPTAAGPKLYRWRWDGGSPTLDYLATLDSGAHDRNNWSFSSGAGGEIGRPEIRSVTPDGERLLVRSVRRLAPAIDRDSDVDVYRWDEDKGWQCLSCQSPGASSTGNSTFAMAGIDYAATSAELRTVMSDDGERVYFTSLDALSPADINGESGCPAVGSLGSRCQDVYEWHDGAINLISSGIDHDPVFLGSVGRTGRDVFFLTRERLVGWDTDDAYDVYDARIGGGFPEPPAEPPLCEGEGCRGGGTDSPAPAGPGSAAFQGAGNPVAAPPGPRRCGRLARGAQRKARVAKRLRRRARRAGNPKAAKRLRRRSRRFAVGAKRNAKQAKRCRRAYRRAGR